MFSCKATMQSPFVLAERCAIEECLQPTRERLVPIAPRAVPVVGRAGAVPSHPIAKRVGDGGRGEVPCRTGLGYQIPPQAPVLIDAIYTVHTANANIVYLTPYQPRLRLRHTT